MPIWTDVGSNVVYVNAKTSTMYRGNMLAQQEHDQLPYTGA